LRVYITIPFFSLLLTNLISCHVLNISKRRGIFLISRYIYTGSANLDANNVLPVLYAANKYDITGLASACVNYVEDRLDVDNACALLEQAHLFDEQDFRARVLELILRKGEDVLPGEDVVELCHQCLTDIAGADNLICKEEQVFDALDR